MSRRETRTEKLNVPVSTTGAGTPRRPKNDYFRNPDIVKVLQYTGTALKAKSRTRTSEGSVSTSSGSKFAGEMDRGSHYLVARWCFNCEFYSMAQTTA